MPATGTPEPGGLFWDETIKIIKMAAQFSHIVGGDINELSPIKVLTHIIFWLQNWLIKLFLMLLNLKKI